MTRSAAASTKAARITPPIVCLATFAVTLLLRDD